MNVGGGAKIKMSLFRTKKSPFYGDRFKGENVDKRNGGRGDCEKPFFEMKLNFAAGTVLPLKLSRLFRTDPLKNSTTVGVSYDHNLVSYSHTHSYSYAHTCTHS